MFVCPLGDEARTKAFLLTHALRAEGISADTDLMGRSLKAQMKYAGKIGVPYIVIIGADELASGRFKLRDMRASGEQTLSEAEIMAFFKDKRA